MRVLIVDDCEMSAGMLAVVLEVYGHEVRRADTAVTAISVATYFDPQIVLLSVSAPVTATQRAAAQQIRAGGDDARIFALCPTPRLLSRRDQHLFDRVFPRPMRFGQLKPYLDAPAEMPLVAARHAHIA
jgi:CheY-like chemotaxis protein